jgi:sigma-E factor negative regulatory protein RseC
MKFVEADPTCNPDAIRHKGIIKRQDNETVFVSIVTQSACDACHAKGICNVTDLTEEIVEVPRVPGRIYKDGDQVEVMMKKALGTRAVMLGYVVPFLLVLATLIISLSVSGNEGFSGVLALVILIPYYILLYAMKRRLKKTFMFNIR